VLALGGVQKTLNFQNVSACMNFDFVTHICQSWKPEFAFKLGKTPDIL
jgi:hypothetical protein